MRTYNTYAIDWDGAYDAWKQSGMSRRQFQYSEHFAKFIRQCGMPSEDTVRTRLRSVRDRRSANYVPPAETKLNPIEFDLTEPVRVFHLDEKKLCDLAERMTDKRTEGRLRRVIMHLPGGRKVEFDSQNAELFALKILFCMEQAA